MGYRDVVLADSPVAYWRLGESSGTTAVDEMAAHNGTYTPNAAGSWTGGTLAQAGALTGDSNTAALFNGTNGHALRTASVLGNSPSAWTLEAWVKSSPAAPITVIGLGRSTNAQPIIAIGSGGGTLGTVQNLRVAYRNDAGTGQYGFVAGQQFGTAFDGTWHHIAATYGAGTLRMYIDGADVGGTSGLSPGTITLDRTAIGALVRTSGGDFVPGTIDEPAIYAATLSAATLLAHYNAGIAAGRLKQGRGFDGGFPSMTGGYH